MLFIQFNSTEQLLNMACSSTDVTISHLELKKLLLESDQHGMTRSKIKPVPMGAQPCLSTTWTSAGPVDAYDEVYPGIILGDYNLAKNIKGLSQNKVTHILNAAQGNKFNQVNTDAAFYAESQIQFFGVAATDIGGFKLINHFDDTSDFINKCLESGGRVYVHCHQGISRSASIVIAYLMMKKGLHLREAAMMIRSKRAILPNDGFLKQLCQLNQRLHT